MRNENRFDINHVFIFQSGEGCRAFVPFRNVSHIFVMPQSVDLILNSGAKVTVVGDEAKEVLAEYKGCVGLD